MSFYIITDRVGGMTTPTSITIHTDKQNLPDFRIVSFGHFTVLEIKAGLSTVSIHLAAGVTLADVLKQVCEAVVD